MSPIIVVVPVAVLLTSVLSGVMGMAGGMILMALLTVLLPVPMAMLVHGVAQGTANGARAWLLRRHIRWRVLPAYVLGAALCLVGFVGLTVVPDPAAVLVLVGLLPWLGLVLPGLDRLDIERRGHAFGCGLVVTAAQLLAGASGPLLDVFYLRTHLDRREVVATKALTQTLGHLLKLGYYGALVSAGVAPSAVLLALVVPAALLGTRIGTGLLEHLDETRFRRWSGRVILAIGAACISTGLLGLVG